MVGKILVLILCCATIANAAADTFYVDSRSGNDTNPGTKDQPLKTLAQVAKKVNVKTERGSTTIKLEPGIYALSEAIVFQNKQSYSEEQRLSIEAAVLPDDPTWNPDLMPIILSIQDSGTPGQPGKPTQTYGLQIKMSHVTIRGLKFLGSPLPNNWYSPLECLENNLKDILVTQCLFIGNTDTLNIYSAVITDGHQFVVDHCIFYGCHACAVFWDGGRGIVGKQNAMRYCIVDGARIAGVWTCDTHEDFEFHHNIITRSDYVWMRKRGGPRTYRLQDCVLVENKHFSGYGIESGATGQTGPEVSYIKNRLVEEGKIILEQNKTSRDYLHVFSNTLGSEIGAGLFIRK